MNTIDIVKLVENNPITKLSKTYNNKLLNKLKSEFSEQQQQLFVASFYCYLNYNQITDFVIDLDNIWEWLGFSQKAMAKRFLEKHFVINKDYKNLLCRSAEQDKRHGGHNKEKIFLTIRAFKLFCIKAGTNKASEIHEYFIKLEQILQETIHEETDELKKQLEEKNEELYKEKENSYTQRHKLLLREFGDVGNIVYIIRVKTFENGNYIIKIGESRNGVRRRFQEHQKNYEEAYILDCYIVTQSRNFEKYLHTHPQIKKTQYVKLEGHEKERELFLINQDLSYEYLQNIISQNIKRFMSVENTEILSLRDEIQNLNNEKEQMNKIIETLKIERPNNVLEQLLLQTTEKVNILIKENEIIKNINKELIIMKNIQKTLLEKINVISTNNTVQKTTNGFGEHLNTLGPRIQQINSDNLQIIKVYESIAQVLNEFPQLKRSSITKAIENNTIYGGFRWLYLDRDLPINTILQVPPTKNIQQQNTGYIAKLNQSKTEIINVYLDKKTASLQNGYENYSRLDNPIKNGIIINGFYYILYENCDEYLKNNFEEKIGGSPLLYKDGVGKFDENNNLINEFSCKYDCIKKMHISDKTLSKILDKDKMYNGFYYKNIGSKKFI